MYQSEGHEKKEKWKRAVFVSGGGGIVGGTRIQHPLFLLFLLFPYLDTRGEKRTRAGLEALYIIGIFLDDVSGMGEIKDYFMYCP